MMIFPADVVEIIDDVYADLVSFAEMWCAMRCFLVLLEHVEGPMGLVACVSLPERASAAATTACPGVA